MIRKKHFILSVFSGFFLSLPWITTSFSWVLFFAFIPLLIVEDQIVNEKKNHHSIVFFCNALITFLVWNVLSTWWIAYVSIPGMLIITIVNAFLMAGVWWLVHALRRNNTALSGYFPLVVFWLTFEYFHFHWSIQWPWMTLGNGFANSIKLVQWFEFTGVLGGSLWILLANVLLFLVYKSFSAKMYTRSIRLLILVSVIVALPVGWSFYRFNSYPEKRKAIEVAVLQPNVDPYTEKFSGMGADEQTHRLVSLAETIVTESTDYVLAPETALTPMWEDETMKQNHTIASIDSLINKYKQLKFVVGAITLKRLSDNESLSYTTRKSDEGYLYNVFNSALMIDRSSDVKIGHKSILVSGVEKMPFQQYFSILGKYVANVGGTSGSLSFADQPTVFQCAGNVKIGSVICFESAFGEYVSSAVKDGANLIFIITNDGWWKDSPGITQHFGFSRLRAVETRRSIARCANTGISGFIDERGELLKTTSVNSQVAISCGLQMNDAVTFYVMYGDYLGWLAMLLSVLMLIYLLLRYIQRNGLDG